jgi:carbon starvation protein CstA
MYRKPKCLRIVLFVVLLLTMTETAFAKRTKDYVPPPYTSRVSAALFTLAPVACLLGVLSYFALSRYGTSTRGTSAILAAAITAACLLVGSCWAATDALNDEAWNPSLIGGLALAAIFPLTLLTAPSKIAWRTRIGLAVVLFPLLLVGLEFLLPVWQAFGMEEGLPTNW